MKQGSEILLSTTPSLDSYEITEYIDIVSAETVYKLSLSKALTSALSNVIDSWKIFSSNELSGTTELIHEAKEYIKSELIKKLKNSMQMLLLELILNHLLVAPMVSPKYL